MKKLFSILFITINMFSISAEMISREYTTDKETGDAVVIEKYEGEEDGVIERKIQGRQLPIATIIKSIYEPNNEYEYTYSVTYNIDLETGIFDRKEFFYNERSVREHSVSTIKKEGDELFLIAETFFKKDNAENIDKTIDTYIYNDENRLKTTIFYNSNREISQGYFEYGEDERPVYVKEVYRNNAEGLKILEDYYSYPDFTFESKNPYFQISTYEDNPHGLLKLIHKENPDGTYFHEYYLDTKKTNDQFNILRTKYSKEKQYIFVEQIYQEKLLFGKVYKLHMDLGEEKKILTKIYYDKDGNEIPESELDISE